LSPLAQGVSVRFLLGNKAQPSAKNKSCKANTLPCQQTLVFADHQIEQIAAFGLPALKRKKEDRILLRVSRLFVAQLGGTLTSMREEHRGFDAGTQKPPAAHEMTLTTRSIIS
jgi:hypothetical protein